MSAVQTVSVDSIFSYPAEALITGNVQLDDCLKMGNRILLIERARALMEARNEELEDLNSDLGAQNVQLVLQNAKLFAEKEDLMKENAKLTKMLREATGPGNSVAMAPPVNTPIENTPIEKWGHGQIPSKANWQSRRRGDNSPVTKSASPIPAWSSPLMPIRTSSPIKSTTILPPLQPLNRSLDKTLDKSPKQGRSRSGSSRRRRSNMTRSTESV